MKERIELGKRYYFFSSFLDVSSSIDIADEMDEERYTIGNYFKSFEAAELAVTKVKELISTIE